MSDIYIPGLRSRFGSEQIIEDLMRIERIPKDRAESNIEQIELEKSYWQELSRRTSALGASARQLFSFQNPFSDRAIISSNEAVLIGTSNRDALEQDRSFTVLQTAQADRFLSSPLAQDFKVEAGTYKYTIGKDEISFDFRGGSLRDFSEALNRRSRDKLQSSLITVRPGTTSLLIESKVTGEENRLGFLGDAMTLGVTTGMIELELQESSEISADIAAEISAEVSSEVSVDETVEIYAEITSEIPLEIDLSEAESIISEDQDAEELTPLVLDKPINFRPLNPVSIAKDAIVSMEGIEISRPSNTIDDLIPGVTITVKDTSDRPVRLQVIPDRENIKEAIISLVGNYNRLMTEINVLTRYDETVIDDISYLTREEREEYRAKLGTLSGDSTLMQLRNSLVRIISSPYPNYEDDTLTLLSQIGVGTDVRRSGGLNSVSLRGYLEIDEGMLDTAIASRLPAIKQLFGLDTTGDMLVDTGVAYSIDSLARPYTESTGLFAQKTGMMNSRIQQEKQRILTLDRQLAAKEADLRKQYAQMESAYNRMEQMGTSFDRFNQQNSPYR